jgi:hypothetical protein
MQPFSPARTQSHLIPHLGRRDEVRHYAHQLLKTQPEITLDHWRKALPDRTPEPRERLIEGLIKADLK